MRKFPFLSVVIPTLNEAKNLPILLADLNRSNQEIEIIVIDSGSKDLTVFTGQVGGAKVIKVKKQNRGYQLNYGASIAQGSWLLFIHADSRLNNGWREAIEKVINEPKSKSTAWFFNFKVKSKSLEFRILELAVFLRSHLLKRPYGDQGLLIERNLYNKVGGYKSIPIMEDLDFSIRLAINSTIKSIKFPLFTSARKWENKCVLFRALTNMHLRNRWKSGESPFELVKEYYSLNKRN